MDCLLPGSLTSDNLDLETWFGLCGSFQFELAFSGSLELVVCASHFPTVLKHLTWFLLQLACGLDRI